jgi:DNA sulfur modification protein DndB
MSALPTQVVIENVIQSKLRGKVIYQSTINSLTATSLVYSKPFNLPGGKGYQRPVNKKRCEDIAQYLTKGDNSLYTPILLNAGGSWEFTPYDRNRPNFGRLLCKDQASLMDGQHRLGGIKLYTEETSSEISVPFLAFHFLDEDEEIELFDVINTKAKGLGSSLSRYLRRDSDDLSWVATELIIRNDSHPFIISAALQV